MKKAPARFPTVKSMVVKGPVGFWPMRPRPRHSIPMETATVGMKAHLSNEKSDAIQRERKRERQGSKVGMRTGSFAGTEAGRLGTEGARSPSLRCRRWVWITAAVALKNAGQQN
jgi:hypothetical protein